MSKPTAGPNRKVVFAYAAALTVVVVVLSGFYLGGQLNLGGTKPAVAFDFSLTINPSNGTGSQGQTVNATTTAVHLQGTPENVTLSADAPDGVTCVFVNATGMPTEGNPFKSTMQINVAPSASAGIYQLNITSAANGKTNSAAYTLNVLRSYVNVSGIVTADFDPEIVPTQITFENTQTHEKFTANVFTTPVTGVPARPIAGLIQTGRYWVLLPNQQDYTVSCSWICVGLPGAHFDRVSSGSFYGGVLSVNCGVGVDSLTGKNYDDNSY